MHPYTWENGICVRTLAYTHTLTSKLARPHMHTRTRTHVHTRAHVRTHAYANAHAQTNTHTQTHTYTRTHTNTPTDTYTHVQTRTHTRTRTHARTHAHKHAHTRTRARKLRLVSKYEIKFTEHFEISRGGCVSSLLLYNIFSSDLTLSSVKSSF